MIRVAAGRWESGTRLDDFQSRAAICEDMVLRVHVASKLPEFFECGARQLPARAFCGAAPAAQVDLRQYQSLADVTRDHSRWALVAEKLAAAEMPPKAMKQPPAAERQQVIDWVRAMRAEEARKNSGDPGVVLMRRLSNAEYNYSIRDLTGVDIRPTREFPVDPANPAGFDNSGASLAMSPALLNTD